MPDWSLVYDDFDPKQEGLREALCTLGNGYFATRGAAAEAEAGDIHYPGTYLAGGYNRLTTEIAGRDIVNEDLVNMPNWLCLNMRPKGGDWFNVLAAEILNYQQTLDMKQGVLERSLRFRDRQGRETSLVTRRLVHMGDPHLAALTWEFVPENWSGKLPSIRRWTAALSMAASNAIVNSPVRICVRFAPSRLGMTPSSYSAKPLNRG